ncbi:MAG: tRNA (cytidine(34)-2'-O)-methyltransferase [Patulibacter minatonensis]
MVDVIFYEPRIPQNTGNAIRLSAVTGAHLHLVEPLGFDLSDAKLRRAGLDYHDLAHLTLHASLDACLEALAPNRVFAFTAQAEQGFTEVRYEQGDALLFGPEPDGLPDAVLADARITELLRIPMLPARRSLNLSNSAAIAVYEVWRQQGFAGAVG